MASAVGAVGAVRVASPSVPQSQGAAWPELPRTISGAHGAKLVDSAGSTTTGTFAQLQVPSRQTVGSIICACLVLEIWLLLLDYHVNYGRLTQFDPIRHFTNITGESGLASWFGTTQTLAVALTVWLLALVARAERTARFSYGGWCVLAALFTYMAVDDGTQLHERVGTVLGGELAALRVFPSYTWQLIFVPAFGLLALFAVGFLWRELTTRVHLGLVFLALSCFVVAVGSDFFDGLQAEHPLNLYTKLEAGYNLDGWTQARFGHTAYETLQHFSRAVEEFLEMVGMTIFWAVFLVELSSRNIRLRVPVRREA